MGSEFSPLDKMQNILFAIDNIQARMHDSAVNKEMSDLFKETLIQLNCMLVETLDKMPLETL